MSSGDLLLRENVQMEVEVYNEIGRSGQDSEAVSINEQVSDGLMRSGQPQANDVEPCSRDESYAPCFDGLDLEVLMNHASNPETTVKLAAVRALRKFTVKSRDSEAIGKLINVGAVQLFVHCLDRHDNHKLQEEAAWALINVAAGNAQETQVVVNAGAVPLLARLMDSSDPEVRRNAVWALSNIIVDRVEFRDLVVNNGFMPKILTLARRDNPLELLRVVIWAIGNLGYRTSPMTREIFKEIFPVLCEFIHHKDVEILKETLQALSRFAAYSYDRTQTILDSGILPTIISLLDHEENIVKTRALKAIVNLTSTDDAQVRVVLDNGLMDRIRPLLAHSDNEVATNALRVVSHVTAGDHTLIQAVIDAGLIPDVIRQLRNKTAAAREYAVRAVRNFADLATTEQMNWLISAGVMAPLFELFTADCSSQLLREILNSVHHILLSPGPHYVRLDN